MDIKASVGKDGVNAKADVEIVQALLNNFVTRLGLKTLETDGDCGGGTRKAIREFQKQIMGIAAPDGRVDPGGRTLARLNVSGATPPAATPAASGATAAVAAELSGKAWWNKHQADFANSKSLLDLASPFRENATAFIKAMRDGGATVSVSSTRRNRIRAYLMHFSFRLGKGQVTAKSIPPEPGCPIIWDHGNEAKSRAAAKEMSDLFGIAFQPSLTSNHITGRAMDITISWSGVLKVADAVGGTNNIGAPRGGGNADLHKVGKSYKVLKLASDPPHWSDNGH